MTYSEGADYMASEKLDIFFETSAKTGENVQKVFFEAAKKILERKNQLGSLNQQYTREHGKSDINLPDLRFEKREKEKGCKC